MSKNFVVYLSVATQFFISLLFISWYVFRLYTNSLMSSRGAPINSPNLLDLTTLLFIPLIILIGTILYTLNFKNKNQAASKIAFSMIVINIVGTLAFIVELLKLASQGSWAILNAMLIILVVSFYIIPAFIWAYLYSKVLPR